MLSSRVRTARSIRGLSFPPAATRAERRHTEKALVDSLNSMQGEFKGRYYPINKMTEEEQKKQQEVIYN